jgi:uncharacterized membrane protein
VLKKLGAVERRVIAGIVRRGPVSTDSNVALDQRETFGERLADQVAAFGGSWTFIGLFSVAMALWIAANARLGRPFDPYPFILLNLLLSCLAAMQAPVIMMSQNRQATRDRLEAHNDYQVNLNSELQVMALHAKFDQLIEARLKEMADLQRQQLDLLEEIRGARRLPAPPADGPA